MSNLFFIQMSGTPGSGKTTLAQALAPHIGAIIIDHNVTKSALLSAEVPPTVTGRASYAVLHALARQFLKQGHNIIFDSPCVYPALLQQGQQIAAEHGAAYRYIECVLTDLAELDQRLQTRASLPSQLRGVYGTPPAGSSATQASEQIFGDWMASAQRPTTSYLVLDTAQPVAAYIDTVITYIRTGIGNR